MCGWPPYGPDHSGRQYATMSAVVQVSVLTTCLSCPLRGSAPPVVQYQVTASISNYVSNTACTQGVNPLANLQSELTSEIELRTTQWLSAQTPAQKMLGCGCTVVCPTNFPQQQTGSLSGNITTHVTSTVHVSNSNSTTWPNGPIVLQSSDTVAVSNFSGPIKVHPIHGLSSLSCLRWCEGVML